MNVVELFKKYNEEIYRFIYIRTGLRKEVGEDLTQEVFLKAIKYRESYNETKSSIRTWLFTIAKNIIIDYYKQFKNDAVPDQESIDTLTSKENIDADITFAFIVNKIKELEEADQELLTYRYIVKLDIVDIAQINNDTYNNTKVKLHRSLNKLKNLINGRIK